MNINSKVVVVTGTNRGIGYGILEHFASDLDRVNWKVIATARNEQLGKAALEKLEQQSPAIKGKFIFHQLDATDVQSILRLKEFIKKEYGSFDILINNAAISYCETGEEENILQLTEETFSINTYGAVRMSDNLIDIINEGGHIINVSSRYGLVNFKDPNRRKQFLDFDNITRESFEDLRKEYYESTKNHSWEKDGWINSAALDNTYAIAKMFLNLYTRILDREVKQSGRNIKVNCCHPGWCKTDMGGPNGVKTYLEGASVPFWLANFPSEHDNSLSGNFYFEKNKHEYYL